jgi:pimeloyl-ACP methyl ester carboxylesterase
VSEPTLVSTPFRVEVPGAEIDDLRRRLRATRWPDPETVDDWSQGIPLAHVRELARYWADEYDATRLATRLNAFPQFRTVVDGVGIHHLHLRCEDPDAPALLLCHGWPGSVVEFLDVLEPLGRRFHLVVPSLPGYGWSDPPTAPGTGVTRIGELFDALMHGLGYDEYVVQGGDWGSIVATVMGVAAPAGLLGVHVNMGNVDPGAYDALEDPTPEERAQRERTAVHRRHGTGYSMQQRTRPQTLGYALADSPVGQLAWIVEKFHAWTDHDGDHEAVVPRDVLLDNVSLYWLTNTATSSARLYWESFGTALRPEDRVAVPAAYSAFPRDIAVSSERLARTRYPDLRHYGTPARGGHFAALERPEDFVPEVVAGVEAILG